MKNKQAFTLIELLVVVLIIGILSAVALPQYQKVVEKARMTEAVMLLHAIARANQLYFLANGEYAKPDEISVLDIEIPGEETPIKRINSKYFMYAPTVPSYPYLAIAERMPVDHTYHMYITQDEPNRIYCTVSKVYSPTDTQRKLCAEINAKGSF